MPFQLKCPHDLLELSGDRSGVKVKAKAGQLHRDGRSACGRSMKTEEVRRATGQCDRIHTWMMRVIFVFVAQRGTDQVRRNFLSALSVTRSNLPLRSRTHWENEIPSSSCGFGSASQTAAITAHTSNKG